jgi:hypothetical protein
MGQLLLSYGHHAVLLLEAKGNCHAAVLRALQLSMDFSRKAVGPHRMTG